MFLAAHQSGRIAPGKKLSRSFSRLKCLMNGNKGRVTAIGSAYRRPEQTSAMLRLKQVRVAVHVLDVRPKYIQSKYTAESTLCHSI